MAKSKRASGDGPVNIVYIHGIGNKVPPRLLKEQWDRALFGAPAEERTRLAYWADLFHPEPLSPGQTGARASAVAAAAAPEDQVAAYGKDAARVRPEAGAEAPRHAATRKVRQGLAAVPEAHAHEVDHPRVREGRRGLFLRRRDEARDEGAPLRAAHPRARALPRDRAQHGDGDRV
jgi:hypothetical protein